MDTIFMNSTNKETSYPRRLLGNPNLGGLFRGLGFFVKLPRSPCLKLVTIMLET